MNGAVDALSGLRDIHAPPLPGLWPPAPGWWLLVGLIVLVTFVIGRVVRRRGLERQQTREILNALAALHTDYCNDSNGARFTAGISRLLRRIALTRFPRQDVASLCGSGWLSFLDATGGGTRFRYGPGKALAAGPYGSDIRVEADALLALATDWVAKNTVNWREH